VPTIVPSTVPTTIPTVVPTNAPSTQPTVVPTIIPSTVPTTIPTVVPTNAPSTQPTVVPTNVPTSLLTTTVDQADINEDYVALIINYGELEEEVFRNSSESFKTGIADTLNLHSSQVLLSYVRAQGDVGAISRRRRLTIALHVTWYLLVHDTKLDELTTIMESESFTDILKAKTENSTGLTVEVSSAMIYGSITTEIDFENITLSEWYSEKGNVLSEFAASTGATTKEIIWKIINITMFEDNEIDCNVNAFVEITTINVHKFYSIAESVQDTTWQTNFIANISTLFTKDDEYMDIYFGDAETAQHVPLPQKENKDAYGTIFIDLELKNITKMQWDSNIMTILSVLADSTESPISDISWFNLKVGLIGQTNHVNVEAIAQIIAEDWIQYNSISNIIQNPTWQDSFEADVAALFHPKDSNTFEVEVTHIETIVQNPGGEGGISRTTSSSDDNFWKSYGLVVISGIFVLGIILLCICCYVCCKKSEPEQKKNTTGTKSFHDAICLDGIDTETGGDVIEQDDYDQYEYKHRYSHGQE